MSKTKVEDKRVFTLFVHVALFPLLGIIVILYFESLKHFIYSDEIHVAITPIVLGILSFFYIYWEKLISKNEDNEIAAIVEKEEISLLALLQNILLIISGIFLLFIIQTVLFSLLPDPTPQASVQSLKETNVYYSLFIGAFLVSISEEMFFRVAFRKAFRKTKVTDLGVAIISSLVFGFFHLQTQPSLEFTYAINSFLSGLVFYLTYVFSGYRAYVPILIHLITNAIVIAGAVL